jgi:hypothetical protein
MDKEYVKWPNGRGMTAIVKSQQGAEEVLDIASAEGRLLPIVVWPQRGRVEVDFDRSAGLRLTRRGQEEIWRTLDEEAKRLGILKKWARLWTRTLLWITHLPVEWVAEQLERILSNPENVECSEWAPCRRDLWRLAADLAGLEDELQATEEAKNAA